MTDSIKPPHAVSLWTSEDVLYVELTDATNSGAPSHQLKLPLNVYGLTQVVNLLRSRSAASRLADRGDPTQHQTDEAIKEMQKKAAGFKGKVKKEVKVRLTPELKISVRDAIRRFINV